MSTLKADAITAVTNNTDIAITGAGSGIVKLGDGALKFPDADGTNGHFIKTDGSAQLAFAAAGYTLGTPQATTSGTTFNFGSIPAGTKHIMITYEAVSLDGTENLLVQIGDSGGIETSGYVSSSHFDDTSSANSTAGFIMIVQNASGIHSGIMHLALVDSSNFTWVASHTGRTLTTHLSAGGGHKDLSAELTQVQFLDTGSDSFDAGSVNVVYSG